MNRLNRHKPLPVSSVICLHAFWMTRFTRSTAFFAWNSLMACSGVGSNLQVGAQCRGEAPAENFLMCPLTFLLCPHMRAHNDCLLPTETKIKKIEVVIEVGRGAIKVMGPSTYSYAVKLLIEAPGFYQYKWIRPPACMRGPASIRGPACIITYQVCGILSK